MSVEAIGRMLWTELHQYAWQWTSAPTAVHQRLAREWLARWAQRIPRGCSCGSGWHDLVALDPPDISSREAFYWWTVAAHDSVNAKLHKPLAAPEWSLRHPLLAPYLGQGWLRRNYPKVVTLTQLS